ncbi:MAG: hypothetical protein K0S01_307 [Herbinix sp.]|jgi:ornithine carbamoyltransferase|nr:hypothetical protein [Herbinix sp.]
MSLIRITDHTKQDINCIFTIAKELEQGIYPDTLKGKTVVLFFPTTSIRTRVTFEKGIHVLGGQSILFPSDALDKKEEIRDVMGYLNQWADGIVVRHKSLQLMEEMNSHSNIPIINAMSSDHHPCEILSDLYAVSKIRENYLNLNYTYIGTSGNIANSWAEAASVLNLSFIQCCPRNYEMKNVKVEYDIHKAIKESDVVLTDSITHVLEDFLPYQITEDLMKTAKQGALLNPCPPFTRGEEVSNDVIKSDFFVGYEYKKSLLTIQQAIMLYHMIIKH